MGVEPQDARINRGFSSGGSWANSLPCWSPAFRRFGAESGPHKCSNYRPEMKCPCANKNCGQTCLDSRSETGENDTWLSYSAACRKIERSHTMSAIITRPPAPPAGSFTRLTRVSEFWMLPDFLEERWSRQRGGFSVQPIPRRWSWPSRWISRRSAKR